MNSWKQYLFGILCGFLFSVPVNSQVYTEYDTVMAYLNLPAGMQMECALIKLNAKLDARRGSGLRAVQNMEEARIALEKAVEAYGSWDNSSGYRPEDSQWTLLQHLWIARSSLETDTLPAAKSALGPLCEALQIVEEDRGWRSFSDGESLTIEAPSSYRIADNPDCRLKLDWRETGSGDVVKTFYITVREALIGMEVYDYQWEVLSRAQSAQEFYIRLEEERTYAGVDGMWCLYSCLWDHKEIWTQVFHRLDGKEIWTITYTARADLFSEEECEGMIRSVWR